MAYLNENYFKLKAGYLFPEIARRVAAFTADHKEAAARLIRCGIGDVTEALPATAREAMKAAVDELGDRNTFRGYGPEQGYAFLREAIAEHAYAPLGCKISPEEIFISDGSKCDTGNILDIFGSKNKIAITDPVYPVYVDTNVMCGQTGDADEAGAYAGLVYLPCTPANGFVPSLPKEKVDRYWGLCDLALVHLKDDPVFETVIPSKMFEAMAYAKPIVLAAPHGEAAELLENSGAGVWVHPSSPLPWPRPDLREPCGQADLEPWGRTPFLLPPRDGGRSP